MQISFSYLDYIWCKTTRWIFNVGNVSDASSSFIFINLVFSIFCRNWLKKYIKCPFYVFWKQVNWGILLLYSLKVFCKVTRFNVTFASKISLVRKTIKGSYIYDIHKKWPIFWPPLPPPSTKMNNDLLLKNNRICKHVTNFKTPPPPSVWTS